MKLDHHYHKQASGNLLFVFILSLVFNIVVIVGGLITNSVAILADSLHDLSDTIAIGLAWVLEKFSIKKSNDKFTYGYQRFSILGAIITSVLVISASTIVIFEAFSRLFETISPNVPGMFIVAILGILFKGISAYKVHGGKTFNEKAILFHLLGDVLEWIAVLFVSIFLMFWNIPILDPLISIAIGIWLIYNLGKTLINSFKVLLQQTPESIDLKLLKDEILEIDGVLAIKDIHVWSLDGLESVLTLKLIVNNDNLNNWKIIRNKINNISTNYKIEDITVELFYN